MRRRPLGVTKPHLPAATLILVLCFLVFLNQLTLRRCWSPPFQGRATLQDKPFGAQDSLATLDPRGWDVVLESSELSQKISQFQIQLMRDSEKQGRPRLKQSLYHGSPRMAFQHRTSKTQVVGELYQSSLSPRLLGGPVTLRLPPGLYRGESLGSSLDILKTLPDDAQRVLVVDPRGLRLPKEISESLLPQWKRWEFDPFVDLGGTLGDTLCYARWNGKTLLSVDLEDTEKVSSVLERRYPESVIKTMSRRAYGSRITGFDLEKKPAWFIRGNQVFGTPDGGIAYLNRYLYTRLEKDGSLRHQASLLYELQRLAQSQKGWHVCLIERPSDQTLQWAMLLNFSETEPGQAEGFLVVEFKQDKDA